jgi:hypothetical protein
MASLNLRENPVLSLICDLYKISQQENPSVQDCGDSPGSRLRAKTLHVFLSRYIKVIDFLFLAIEFSLRNAGCTDRGVQSPARYTAASFEVAVNDSG